MFNGKKKYTEDTEKVSTNTWTSLSTGFTNEHELRKPRRSRRREGKLETEILM
jgi:hypothetical protein